MSALCKRSTTSSGTPVIGHPVSAIRLKNKDRKECIVINNDDIDALLDLFEAGLDICDGMVTIERKRLQLLESIAVIDEFEDIILSVGDMARSGNLRPEEYLRSLSSIFKGGPMERNPEYLKNILTLYYKKLVRKPKQIWVPEFDDENGRYKKANHHDDEDSSVKVFKEILNMKEDLLELQEEKASRFS